MPGYSNPLVVNYAFGSTSFTSSPPTHLIKPPYRHNRGRIFDIHVRVTTTFTATTTAGKVQIGSVATANLYAELAMGTAASGVSWNVRDGVGTGALSTVIKKDIDLNRDGITTVQVKVVAPTGGTPAGAGYLDVIIGWS